MRQPFCVLRVPFFISAHIFQIVVFNISLRIQSYHNSTFSKKRSISLLQNGMAVILNFPVAIMEFLALFFRNRSAPPFSASDFDLEASYYIK